jgi:hypothetical protein
MDTEQLEKQLPIWNKLMYMALGSAITFVIASPNNFSQVGIVWLLIQIAITPPGFFLLFGKRWKTLPLSRERINTAFGYLIASWLSLFVPLIMGGGDDTYNLLLLAYTAFLGWLYWRIQKKFSNSDEMFP